MSGTRHNATTVQTQYQAAAECPLRTHESELHSVEKRLVADLLVH